MDIIFIALLHWKWAFQYLRMINEQENDITFILFEQVRIQSADVLALFEDAISFARVGKPRSRNL